MASKEYISTTSSVAAVPRSKRLREAGGGTSGGGGGHSVVNVNMDADVSGKADIDDVERALAEKQDVLTFDTVPTTGSTNPVTSGGVAAAIAAETTARQNADALKADAADVYTKEEVDAQCAQCGIVTDEYDEDSDAEGRSSVGVPGKFYDGFRYRTYGAGSQTALGAPIESEGSGCIRVAVKQGDHVKVSAKGVNSQSRAYCLTDKDRYSTLMAADNTDTTSNPVTLDVEEDGFLYANCASDAFSSFFVEVRRGQAVRRVSALERDTTALKASLGVVNYTTLERGTDPSTTGNIWLLNVSKVGTTTFNHDVSVGWGCLRVNVKEGDRVMVSAKGAGGNYRAYAVTDTERNVLVKAEENTDTTSSPVTLIIEEDGYVYVNHNAGSSSEFFVRVFPDYVAKLADKADKDDFEALAADVSDLQEMSAYVENHGADELYFGTNPERGRIWLLRNKKEDEEFYRVDKSNYTANQGWGCLRVPVVAGDRVMVSTVGSQYYYHAYAVTDVNRVVLLMAADNTDTTSNPVTLPITVDGYVYVNCNYGTGNSHPNFFVKVMTSVKDRVASVIESLEAVSPRYRNFPLPLWQGTLRVLALGNSFINDSLAYLDDLVTASGINKANLCVYGLVLGGSTPQDHVDRYDANTAVGTSVGYAVSSSNPARFPNIGTLALDSTIYKTDTYAEVLAHNWDVVVINEYTMWSYSEYVGPIGRLVRAIREHCINQRVAIAWHSVWGYTTGHSTYGTSEAGWAAMCKATQEQMRRDGIDIIIPTGTAVQNARNTYTFSITNYPPAESQVHQDVPSHGELSRDGCHMGFGAGRYLAACTWFQSLLSPMFGMSVLGNTAVHTCTLAEHLWPTVFTRYAKTITNPAQQGLYEYTGNTWDDSLPDEENYYVLSGDATPVSGKTYYERTGSKGDNDGGADHMGNITYAVVDVDSDNNEVLQRCALAACCDMWNITDDIDPIPEPTPEPETEES